MSPLKMGASAALAVAIAAIATFAVAPRTLARLPWNAAAPPLHYAPNHNFGPHDAYLPGSLGFDLADVSSPEQLAVLPAGVKGLAWIGQCGGVNAQFLKTVNPYAGHSNLFGFYLADDPNPHGGCAPALLRAEADWIHEHFPNAKTYITMMNLARSQRPSYLGSYTPDNSHVDLFGIAVYPCRVEWRKCDLWIIGAAVAAAETAGIPRDDIVPVYQAFGGGEWKDDEGGVYAVPVPAEAEQMLARWHKLIPHPVFDMAYSWGSQQGDVALADAPGDLRAVFARHNRRDSAE